MKRLIVIAVLIWGVGISNCKKEKEQNLQTENSNKNLISIVEIPIVNFSRALNFYQTILGVSIEKVDIAGTQMGVLKSLGDTVNVILVKGNDYTPSTNGILVYLNAGKDLLPTLEKIEKNGGKILLPKTEISPEMGYFAHFIDSEGNKIGLYSKQ